MARFHKIYIEISDICNLKCTFCPPKKGKRGVMPVYVFESIATQVTKYTNLVSLHVLGDPLCLYNIEQYINIANNINLKLDIVSSGIFLHDKQFDILCSNNIHQVSFSLDAFYDNEKYNSSFNKSEDDYINTIIRFYLYAKKYSPNLYINLRLFNNYDYSIFLDKFKEYVPQPTKRRIRLDKNFFLRFHTPFKWHSKNIKSTNQIQIQKNINKPYCLGGIKQLAILANGIVVPCCIDVYNIIKLGDLTLQSFDEILESKEFISFCNSQYSYSNLPPICKICTFRGV